VSFVDLLVNGVLVQAILALGVVGAWIYAEVVQGGASDNLNTVTMLVIGVFFGGLVSEGFRAIRSRRKALDNDK